MEGANMAFTNLTLDKAELVGTLTLNRPEKLNAMTPQLIAEFGEAIIQVEKDPEIKVVIIRGAGRFLDWLRSGWWMGRWL